RSALPTELYPRNPRYRSDARSHYGTKPKSGKRRCGAAMRPCCLDFPPDSELEGRGVLRKLIQDAYCLRLSSPICRTTAQTLPLPARSPVTLSMRQFLDACDQKSCTKVQ